MKKANKALLAKKYAAAFLNVFIDEVPLEHFKQVCALATFLHDHRHFLFFLTVPALDDAVKQQAILNIVASFKLGEPFRKLVMVLAADKRLFLLHRVFSALCSLYKKRKGIEVFTIATSHTLEEEERAYVVKFLATITGKTVMCKDVIDASLIAGIRLQSDAYLWEYSVRKQLEVAKDSFMH